MATNIEIPQSFAELVQDPKRIKDALELLNALANLQVHLVPTANVPALSSGNKSIRGDPPNLILTLPLQTASPWAAASGTATRTTFATSTVTTAQLAERVKALIDDLQSVKILPGS